MAGRRRRDSDGAQGRSLRRRVSEGESAPQENADVPEVAESNLGEAAGASRGQAEPVPQDAGEVARRRFLNIARSRAAHFAHFRSEEDASEEPGQAGTDRPAEDRAGREEWHGPFAVARQLVAGRAAAAEARERGRGNSRGQQQGDPQSSVPGTEPLIPVEWKPSRKAPGKQKMEAEEQPKPSMARVPRLYDMCTLAVCRYADQLAESLGQLPDKQRVDLMRMMCARRKLSGKLLVELVCGGANAKEASEEMAEDTNATETEEKGKSEVSVGDMPWMDSGMMELRMADCSLITQDDMEIALKHSFKHGLESLELNFCGRSLTDICVLRSLGLESSLSTKAASLLPGTRTSGTVTPRLVEISLGGVYGLSIRGLEALMGLAEGQQETGAKKEGGKKQPQKQELHTLHLSQCSLLKGAGLSMEHWHHVRHSLRSLHLDNCAGLDAVFLTDALELLRSPVEEGGSSSLEASGSYTNEGRAGAGLRSLSVAELPGLNDVLLSRIVKALGSNLESLGLANCSELSDNALQSISDHCPKLRSLDISFLHKVSDEGVACLSSKCLGLRSLILTRVSKLSSDALVEYIRQAGSFLQKISVNAVRKVDDRVLHALASYCSASLEEVDASWCRSVTDNALGYLADTCPNLRRMHLYGCSQVTPYFYNGHSNTRLELLGLVGPTKA